MIPHGMPYELPKTYHVKAQLISNVHETDIDVAYTCQTSPCRTDNTDNTDNTHDELEFVRTHEHDSKDSPRTLIDSIDSIGQTILIPLVLAKIDHFNLNFKHDLELSRERIEKAIIPQGGSARSRLAGAHSRSAESGGSTGRIGYFGDTKAERDTLETVIKLSLSAFY